MHDVGEVDVLGSDADPDLLLGFANQGVDHGFAGFQVAGGQVPGPVLEAGVLALTEEHVASAAQHEVNIASDFVSPSI